MTRRFHIHRQPWDHGIDSTYPWTVHMEENGRITHYANFKTFDDAFSAVDLALTTGVFIAYPVDGIPVVRMKLRPGGYLTPVLQSSQ